MIEGLIVLAALAAAAYLLYPLLRGRRGRLLLILLPALLAAFGQVSAQAMQPDLSIGLMLIAVDVQRDHLRVSEAMRVANVGPPRELDLTFTLPARAVYLTAHRGLRTTMVGPGRFRARLTIPRGVSEIGYSYALPSGSTQVLDRAFPLRVQRLEVVIRGRGAGFTASRGGAMEPLDLGGERLPRWEVRELRAGEPVMLSLRGLPVSRRWLPPAAAGAFAVLLAGGFAAAVKVRAPAAVGKVEESPPVRRN